MISHIPQLSWIHFAYFALPCMAVLAASALSAMRHKHTWAIVWGLSALVILGVFIAGMWLSLERPPLRTMGETRLWYSFFVIIAGLITYVRWRYIVILSFSGVLSSVFMLINIFKPEIHNKSMMPALESPYFVPHVISYIFAYALLGAGLLLGLYILYRSRHDRSFNVRPLLASSDNLVYTGLAFLMVGLILGCLWAKVAWGTYWSWDPKETWAAITLLSYLMYVHHRIHNPKAYAVSFLLLGISFLFLQICWYGVNYLPAAQGVSIHTYSN